MTNATILPNFLGAISDILVLSVVIGIVVILEFLILIMVVKQRERHEGIKERVSQLESKLGTIETLQPNLEEVKVHLKNEVLRELKKATLKRLQNLSGTNYLLTERVNRLELRLKHTQPEVKPNPSNQPPNLSSEPPPQEPLPNIPSITPPGQISTEEMLAWARETGLVLKPVKASLGLFGNFSPSENGDNWLAENTNPEQQSFLFPRLDRFETATHYDIYRSYYTCLQPAAGRIVIERPALVEIDPAQGGWKLKSQGALIIAS